MHKFLFIVCLIILGACSFRPMYKEKIYNDLLDQTSQITIAPVRNFDASNGVDLRNNLLNKLTPYGKPSNPKYSLSIELMQPNIGDYTITNEGVASSQIVFVGANYTLTNLESREVVIEKNIVSNMAYNILKDQFSTEMLKKNAIKLAIDNIAERIYFSIISYFTEK